MPKMLPDRALEQGPAYPWEIAEFTGLAVKTVKNTLTGLRKQGVVEATGETEGRMEQVRLSVPASLGHIRDGDVGTLENEHEATCPLTHEEAREVDRLTREGMAPRFARAVVLGRVEEELGL